MERYGTVEKLQENTRAELPRAVRGWLADVRPEFEALLKLSLDPDVTDMEFVHAVEELQARMPELYGKMNHGEIADLLEAAMGAAAVNGAQGV